LWDFRHFQHIDQAPNVVAVRMIYLHNVDILNPLRTKVVDNCWAGRSHSAINEDTEAARVPNERSVSLSHIDVSDLKGIGGRLLTVSKAESEPNMG
jgi:hypothetical protein